MHTCRCSHACQSRKGSLSYRKGRNSVSGITQSPVIGFCVPSDMPTHLRRLIDGISQRKSQVESKGLETIAKDPYPAPICYSEVSGDTKRAVVLLQHRESSLDPMHRAGKGYDVSDAYGCGRVGHHCRGFLSTDAFSWCASFTLVCTYSCSSAQSLSLKVAPRMLSLVSQGRLPSIYLTQLRIT